MLSAGGYLAGVLELAVVVFSLGLAAVRLRARLLPGWDGAPARLVEAVAAVALLIWLGELLGAVGLLREWSLLAASIAVGAGSLALSPPAGEGGRQRLPAPPVAPLAMLVTAGVAGLLFFHWGVEAKQNLDGGIANFDSLWYHMPFALEIADSGSTTGLLRTETVFLNWFYPQNSELVHAAGLLLTERDTLSLFINIGWLAMALLAAWCAGRPYGRGPLTVAAAAIALEMHTLVVREPGAAKNDVAAAALLLATVAIVINAWAGRERKGAGATSSSPPPSDASGLIGWPLAAAGLAAGLAAGTKVTVLAPIAALSLAALALAPAGRRRIAAVWWFLPLIAGGAFWYLRNLLISGNPIPQVQEIGPLALPGPERLQTGRPDFTVLHYATDTAVWRDYFEPGLSEAFGTLWPLVILVALAGAILALVRGQDRALRWMGGVALFGMLAYLATPLSAAGADGAPEAFGINIRFLVPALLAGLVLLPLGPGLESPGRQWALLAGLLLLLVITNESYDVLRTPERLFGLLVALLAVAVPAGLLLARSRGAAAGAIAAGFGLLAVTIVAIGYPVQRDYLRDRFRAFEFAGSLQPAYRWAADLEDARIGLAGTTAGFLNYGFYGTDLSNEVRYLGHEAGEGGFDAIPSCPEFRKAVNDADLDFVVTTPFLNFIDPEKPLFSPEARWLAGDPAVRPLRRDGRVIVWQVRGELDPAGCGRVNAPLRFVPDTPG